MHSLYVGNCAQSPVLVYDYVCTSQYLYKPVSTQMQAGLTEVRLVQRSAEFCEDLPSHALTFRGTPLKNHDSEDAAVRCQGTERSSRSRGTGDVREGDLKCLRRMPCFHVSVPTAVRENAANKLLQRKWLKQ